MRFALERMLDGDVPTVGVYSRLGVYHPGPLREWLFVVPYALGGGRASTLPATALVLNVAWLLACSWLAARCGAGGCRVAVGCGRDALGRWFGPESCQPVESASGDLAAVRRVLGGDAAVAGRPAGLAIGPVGGGSYVVRWAAACVRAAGSRRLARRRSCVSRGSGVADAGMACVLAARSRAGVVERCVDRPSPSGVVEPGRPRASRFEFDAGRRRRHRPGESAAVATDRGDRSVDSAERDVAGWLQSGLDSRGGRRLDRNSVVRVPANEARRRRGAE